MRYTKQEIILLNIFMRRLLDLSYHDIVYTDSKAKPEYVGVDKWSGVLRFSIGFNLRVSYILGYEYKDTVKQLAKAYGLNENIHIHLYNNSMDIKKHDGEDNDYTIYRDNRIKGKLKPNM